MSIASAELVYLYIYSEFCLVHVGNEILWVMVTTVTVTVVVML